MYSDSVSEQAIREAAQRLRTAFETGEVCEPIRDVIAADDLSGAYAVQHINTELDVEAGRRIVGRKVGLTNPVVQAQLGVDQPDFGTLFSDMGYADGVEIPSSRLIQPKAEAEVALVLDDALDLGTHNIIDIINATAYALPALEIVDSRIKGWDIRFVDTVGDNGSSALYVVGSQPVSLAEVDLRAVEMTMSVNGEQKSEGNGSLCLYNPLHAAIWLADALCKVGTPLQAGDIVLTGALGPMVDVAPGDSVVAEISGLGTVRTSFSK